MWTQAPAQTLQIDDTKARYIEAFMDFVRWDGAVNSGDARIGVLGSQELVQQLNRVATESTGRMLRIEAVKIGDDLSDLDVLFVSKGYRKHWPSLRKSSKKHRILLIGEEEGFVEAGGCIEFVVRKNRTRFMISRENIERHGMEVSSKLVGLAAN